jgi:uncharacterized membrane protein
MNHWYGIRIPATFASEEAWFEINQYAGRLLLVWGIVIAGTAIVGTFLKKKDWIVYNWIAVVVVAGGLAIVLVKVMKHARKYKKSEQPSPPPRLVRG